MVGAPLMASHAAARCGAGMVVCALPGAEAAARASTGEIVARALPATSEGSLDADAAGVVLKDVDRFHAVAIGPGLGRDERTQAAVRQIVAECATPIVVDADGLNALAVDPAPLRQRHRAGFLRRSSRRTRASTRASPARRSAPTASRPPVSSRPGRTRSYC